jgi:GTPase SAR1 family protein
METYSTIAKWSRQVLSLKPMPTIILGNKCDTPDEKQEVREESFTELRATLKLEEKEVRV